MKTRHTNPIQSRNMRNIKLTIEYDGTDFHGWQCQPNCRTVQEEIETAICKLTGIQLRITGSGRTDSGVHAWNQTANFRIESDLPIHVFRDGLNNRLPKDVNIRQAEEVSLEFNARHDAKRRYYRYQVIRRFSPIQRNFTWFIRANLDLEAMQTAAECLLGRHDFETFCASGSVVDHYLVDVYESGWRQEGELLLYEICANRFLYSMVRSLVGTMVEIGRGKIPAPSMLQLLNARSRPAAGPSAPASGLFLVKVEYN